MAECENCGYDLEQDCTMCPNCDTTCGDVEKIKKEGLSTPDLLHVAVGGTCSCECNRCGHHWVKRVTGTPKTCPGCKSPYWNKPRKRARNVR